MGVPTAAARWAAPLSRPTSSAQRAYRAAETPRATARSDDRGALAHARRDRRQQRPVVRRADQQHGVVLSSRPSASRAQRSTGQLFSAAPRGLDADDRRAVEPVCAATAASAAARAARSPGVNCSTAPASRRRACRRHAQRQPREVSAWSAACSAGSAERVWVSSGRVSGVSPPTRTGCRRPAPAGRPTSGRVGTRRPGRSARAAARGASRSSSAYGAEQVGVGAAREAWEAQRAEAVDWRSVPRGLGAPRSDEIGEVRGGQARAEQRHGGRGQQHVADVVGPQQQHSSRCAAALGGERAGGDSSRRGQPQQPQRERATCRRPGRRRGQTSGRPRTTSLPSDQRPRVRLADRPAKRGHLDLEPQRVARAAPAGGSGSCRCARRTGSCPRSPGRRMTSTAPVCASASTISTPGITG